MIFNNFVEREFIQEALDIFNEKDRERIALYWMKEDDRNKRKPTLTLDQNCITCSTEKNQVI